MTLRATAAWWQGLAGQVQAVFTPRLVGSQYPGGKLSKAGFSIIRRLVPGQPDGLTASAAIEAVDRQFVATAKNTLIDAAW